MATRRAGRGYGAAPRIVLRAALLATLVSALVVALLVLLAAGGCGRGRRGPNIVLVVLDTVRDDYCGIGGNQDQLTPYLDRLAAEGTQFTRTWSNAPWTVPSHASFFTGLLPSQHGCTSQRIRFQHPDPTVAELLRDAGYRTGAFFSNPWLHQRATGLLRGFTVQQETKLPDLFGGDSWDQGGQRISADVARWLDQDAGAGEQPFFLFVNFLEAHLPYCPPEDYRRRRLADLPLDDMITVEWGHEFNAGLIPADQVDWDRVRRLYGGDVNTADRLLAGLIGILRERGLYEDTVLIVTSDHGENLGEHGLVEHQFGLQETLLRVPLVIRAPALLAPGRRDDPVMLTDLYATILGCAGVAEHPERPSSRSLLLPAAEPGRPMVAEYAGPLPRMLEMLRTKNPDLDRARLGRSFRSVRLGDLRLTVGSDESFVLHDLAADPAQLTDLAAERPQVVDDLSRLLRALSRPILPGATTGTDMDEDLKARLRSLGYVH